MNWLKVPALIKYFLGILLIQAVSGILVYAALQNPTTENQILFVVIGASLGLVGAFWFSSIAGGDKKEALARATERLSKERERYKVRAEKEKNKIREQTQKLTAKRLNLSSSKSNFKMGVSTIGLVGIGGLLLVTQFVSLGALIMGVSGGTLAGYLLRIKQEQKRKSGNQGEGLLTSSWGNRLTSESDTDQPEEKKRLKVIKSGK